MANGPIVNVQVLFFPDQDGRIEARPERAMIDWGKKERAQWRLASTDQGATLHKIEFVDDPPNGPFGRLEQDPNDPKVWNGTNVKEVDGEWKYDITVKDGSGVEHVLDPVLVTGQPPGG